MSKFKFDDEEEIDYNLYRKEGRKSRLNNKWRDKRKQDQDKYDKRKDKKDWEEYED